MYNPRGTPTCGGDRIGDNLFGNCVVALNAKNGERIWHYQIVRHDVWDYDLACQPTLLRMPHEGRMIDAVVQGTKMGLLYFFDRETGTLLRPPPAATTMYCLPPTS